MRRALIASVIGLATTCRCSAQADERWRPPEFAPPAIIHPALAGEGQARYVFTCGEMKLTILLSGHGDSFDRVTEISWDGRQVSPEVLAAFQERFLLFTRQKFVGVGCYPGEDYWVVVFTGARVPSIQAKAIQVLFSHSQFDGPLMR